MRLFITVIALSFLAAAPAASQSSGSTIAKARGKGMEFPQDGFASRGADWFCGAQALRFADNCLTFQTPAGGWPKNMDLVSRPRSIQTSRPDFDDTGTFDNNGTIPQIRFMAAMYKATHQQRFLDAYRRALDFVFQAQYPNGGWPQFYPHPANYQVKITFNDDAMTNVMAFLLRLSNDNSPWVDAATRRRAQEAFDRGVECILKCQIRVNGQLTGWCAQHDPNTFEPAKARPYELPSISGSEGAYILDLLMDIQEPSPAVRASINAAAAWFERSKITGIRLGRVNGDRVVIADPNAQPIWARFYDIATNKPMFCGRTGVVKWSIAEIDPDRRNGYNWYTRRPAWVLEKYKKWRETHGE
ncbi:MAG: pectate lyase [Phycisphaerae bacterium]